jgi:hypothetical protein
MLLEVFPSSRSFAALLRNNVEAQPGTREALVP